MGKKKIIAYVYKDGLWHKQYASGRLEVCTIEETAKIEGEDYENEDQQ